MCTQCIPSATSDFSVIGLTAGIKIKTIFLKSGTNLGAKSISGPNQESAQNVETKSAFTPINFHVFVHFGYDYI